MDEEFLKLYGSNEKIQNPITIFIGTFFGFVVFQILLTVLIALVIEPFFPNIFPLSLFFIEFVLIMLFVTNAAYFWIKNKKIQKIGSLFHQLLINNDIEDALKSELVKITKINNSNTENLFFSAFTNSNNKQKSINIKELVKKFGIESEKDKYIFSNLIQTTRSKIIEIFIEIFLKWLSYVIIIIIPFFTWGLYDWFSVISNVIFSFFILFLLRISVNNKFIL